jgi:hypothetical protein
MEEMHKQAAQQSQQQPQEQPPAQPGGPPAVEAQPQGLPPGQNVSADIDMANPEEPLHVAAKGQYEADLRGEEETPNVTNDEQAEYQRVAEGMGDMLYRDDKMSNAVEQMLNPDDKMGSTIQAGVILMQQLDDRLDMDGLVVSQVTQDMSNGLMEIGEAKGLQFTPREMQQVTAGIWEGVMAVWGGEDETMNEDYATVTEGMAPEEIEEAKASYQQLLNEGTGAGEMVAQAEQEGVKRQAPAQQAAAPGGPV